MDWTPAMQHWLEESCRASGVPLRVSDPATLAKIATLLCVPATHPSQGDHVARNEAAKLRQGLSSKNGKATRSAREVGQYGNSRPREDASVRRARRVQTDGRLRSAKAEQEAHERKLAELDATLAGQVHIPYQPTFTIVAEEIPAVPKTAPTEDIQRARELLVQGYHITRVADRTGVPVERLQSLVGVDGYARPSVTLLAPS